MKTNQHAEYESDVMLHSYLRSMRMRYMLAAEPCQGVGMAVAPLRRSQWRSSCTFSIYGPEWTGFEEEPDALQQADDRQRRRPPRYSSVRATDVVNLKHRRCVTRRPLPLTKRRTISRTVLRTSRNSTSVWLRSSVSIRRRMKSRRREENAHRRVACGAEGRRQQCEAGRE
jgi:hypothetical protein